MQLTIHRFKHVGRLGLMHLVATNLAVWIRLIVDEQFLEAAEPRYVKPSGAEPRLSPGNGPKMSPGADRSQLSSMTDPQLSVSDSVFHLLLFLASSVLLSSPSQHSGLNRTDWRLRSGLCLLASNFFHTLGLGCSAELSPAFRCVAVGQSKNPSEILVGMPAAVKRARTNRFERN